MLRLRIEGELIFVSLFYMLAPAFLVHVNGTFGAVINMGLSLFATNRTFHDSLPPLSFFLDPSGLAFFPFSSRESVT